MKTLFTRCASAVLIVGGLLALLQPVAMFALPGAAAMLCGGIIGGIRLNA